MPCERIHLIRDVNVDMGIYKKYIKCSIKDVRCKLSKLISSVTWIEETDLIGIQIRVLIKLKEN